MPTLYRKYCPTCDPNTETDVTCDGIVGAVITKSRQGGEIISDGYFAYLSDQGDLVPLPHPVESRALQAAAGVTWTQAAIHGRLIHIHNLICTDCGTQSTTATLHTGGAGCIAGLQLAGIAIALNTLVFSFHPIIEVFLVWAAMFAPLLIMDRYIWLRYRGNASSYQTRRCRQCGGSHVRSLARARKYSLCCPRCRQMTMKIEITGRS